MDIPKEIIKVFDNVINPRLSADHGSAEPVSFADGVLTVRMGGACRGCLAVNGTLDHVIRKSLAEHCPGLGVRQVVADHSVDPELWELAQRILKGDRL